MVCQYTYSPSFIGLSRDLLIPQFLRKVPWNRIQASTVNSKSYYIENAEHLGCSKGPCKGVRGRSGDFLTSSGLKTRESEGEDVRANFGNFRCEVRWRSFLICWVRYMFPICRYQGSKRVSTIFQCRGASCGPKNGRIPENFPYWVTDSGEILLFFPFSLAHKLPVNSSCRTTPIPDLLCSQYVH